MFNDNFILISALHTNTIPKNCADLVSKSIESIYDDCIDSSKIWFDQNFSDSSVPDTSFTATFNGNSRNLITIDELDTRHHEQSIDSEGVLLMSEVSKELLSSKRAPLATLTIDTLSSKGVSSNTMPPISNTNCEEEMPTPSNFSKINISVRFKDTSTSMLQFTNLSKSSLR